MLLDQEASRRRHARGLSYADVNGARHPTHRLAPDFQGCRAHDPRHDWPSVQRQFNHGKCDGWLKTAPLGDTSGRRSSVRPIRQVDLSHKQRPIIPAVDRPRSPALRAIVIALDNYIGSSSPYAPERLGKTVFLPVVREGTSCPDS
jgi:hypothetical protein